MNVISRCAGLAHGLALAAPLLLSACAGAPPPAPTLSAVIGLKSLELTWSPVAEADYYDLQLDLGDDSAVSRIRLPSDEGRYVRGIAVHKVAWETASAALEACNAAGCSPPASVGIEGRWREAVGEFRVGSMYYDYARFGSAVAVSGDGRTLVAGTAHGKVYVFRREGWSWRRDGELTGCGPNQDRSLAVSADGNTLLVNAYMYYDEEWDDWTGEVTRVRTGAIACVFVRRDGAWSKEASLTPADDAGWEELSASSVDVAADGDTVVVGVPDEDGSATGVGGPQLPRTAPRSGAAYVFARSAGGWQQQAYIKATNAERGDELGRVVALSDDGNTLAIGAWKEDEGAGAAYVYRRTGTLWEPVAYVKPSESGRDQRFGSAVALAGDGLTLVVGAWNFGSVYTFTQQAGVWSQAAVLRSPDSRVLWGFGSRLALSGDGTTLAAHEPTDVVRVFSRLHDTWTERARLESPHPSGSSAFGEALALDDKGNVLAVGDWSEDVVAPGAAPDTAHVNAGAVYLY